MTGLKIAPPSLFLSFSVYISGEWGGRHFRPPSPASRSIITKGKERKRKGNKRKGKERKDDARPWCMPGL